MSDSNSTEKWGGLNHDEAMSALFAQMVIQQSNMAMILLGKVPHPESGKTMLDLEGARLFIDQLEMLEVKTRGNLSSQETILLKQSLVSLQMAFVEAVEAPKATPPPAAAQPAAPQPPPGGSAQEDDKKKFSKKY